MFVLRVFGKMLLIPVWMFLGISWLSVYLAVNIFGIMYGLWMVFLTLFIILSLAFGMYQNALILMAAVGITFLVLSAETFIEMLLKEVRKRITNCQFAFMKRKYNVISIKF